jgi:hypothetical protein
VTLAGLAGVIVAENGRYLMAAFCAAKPQHTKEVCVRGEQEFHMDVNKVATGFDLEPRQDGNVLMEFFGDDGKTFHKQIVTEDVVRSMPLVASMTLIAIEQGVDALVEVMDAAEAKTIKEENQ